MCSDSKFAGDVSGCDCLEDSWIAKANNLCVALGDCGIKENYLGQDGFYDEQNLYISGKGDSVPKPER